MASNPKFFLARPTIIAFGWLAVTICFIVLIRPDYWNAPHDNYMRARHFERRELYENAVESMRAAVSEAPDDVGYLIYLGYLELKIDADQAAHDHFERAVGFAPRNVEALLGLAKADLRLGERENALALLDRALRHDPLPSQRHRIAQMAAMAGEHERALARLKELLDAAPVGLNMESLRREALALAVSIGDWDYAASVSQPLTAAAGEESQSVWNNRAIALRALGRTREAYRLLMEHPDPSNLRTRAELALQLEEFAEAADLYDSLVASNQAEGHEIERKLAYALARSDREEQALNTYAELVAAGTADEETRIRYAWLLNEREEHELAWRVLQPLPRPHPDTEVLQLQARTAFWAGEMAEAGRLLTTLMERRQATETDAGSPEVIIQ
jgi:tetratricopeptide (TPR) repeat protein